MTNKKSYRRIGQKKIASRPFLLLRSKKGKPAPKSRTLGAQPLSTPGRRHTSMNRTEITIDELKAKLKTMQDQEIYLVPFEEKQKEGDEDAV